MSGRVLEPPLVPSEGHTLAAAGQLDLPFGPIVDDRPALIVTGANAAAVELLERPGDWPANTLILVGPRRSGRSLHARLGAARGARVLDDAETRPEEELFDAWNVAQTTEPLLLVADAPPPAWRPALPDLRSRLAVAGVVILDDPDDAMADALLEMLLLRRGVPSTAALRRLALRPLPRTHLSIARLSEAVAAPGALSRHSIRCAHLALGALPLHEVA